MTKQNKQTWLKAIKTLRLKGKSNRTSNKNTAMNGLQHILSKKKLWLKCYAQFPWNKLIISKVEH